LIGQAAITAQAPRGKAWSRGARAPARTSNSKKDGYRSIQHIPAHIPGRACEPMQLPLQKMPLACFLCMFNNAASN